MERYIGTKIVLAEPMDAFAFTRVRTLPGEEVVTVDKHGKGRDGYRVVYEDGYVSWSPKETFERAYRRVTDAERVLIETGEAG